jgi:hypothetical protein
MIGTFKHIIQRHHLRGWLVPAIIWGYLIYSLVSHGGWVGVILILIMLVWGAAFWFVGCHTVRPKRTFLILTLLSLALGGWVVSAAISGGVALLGVLGWAGTSLLALIWCIHYERTEPLG